MAARHALVLGGGGVAGIAWETGVLHGLADAGLDVTGADYIIGTSAGATVAAQLGSGLPLGDWFARLVDPAQQNKELRSAGMSVAELWETMIRIHEAVPDPAEQRRRIGAMALAADTVAESVRRSVIAGRIAGDVWPERRIAIVAMEATSGERSVFDSDSGVGLVDAVAASCAVPGIWPPVLIGGARYVDGGICSSCNADLAAGSERALILAPLADPELDRQVELLGATGRVLVVSPDMASLQAFGTDPLDPSVRAPVAEAGRAQGRRSVDSVAGLWSL
ncbi:MAG TPA: patatin-like phospholipase family protein [Acidimicrobiales bacterium]